MAVDSLALIAAEAALADQVYLQQTVRQIRLDVIDMGTELRRLPFARVSPSDANFHLVELGEHAWDRLAPALEREGMVVRRRPDMPGHMRVTSMRPAANRALLDALARVAR